MFILDQPQMIVVFGTKQEVSKMPKPLENACYNSINVCMQDM